MKKFDPIFFGVVGTLVLMVVVALFYRPAGPEPYQVEKLTDCFYGTMLPGYRISTEGTDDIVYTLIVSRRGIELWGPCQ